MEQVEVKLLDKKCKIKNGMKLSVPVYGIGTIVSIENKEILGQKLTFCELIFKNDNLKLTIPINKFQEMKVRNIISADAVKKLFEDILDKTPKSSKNNWTKRIQEYEEKLKSGNINLVAELVRDLFICTKDFNKSYGERNIYSKALDLLVEEISIALNQNESETNKNILDILNKNIKSSKVKLDIDNVEDETDDFKDEDFYDDEEDEDDKKHKKQA